MELTAARLPTLVPTRATIEDMATVALGGRAADMVLGNGANAGAGTDLAGATQRLADAIERQGLGETLVHIPEVGLKSATFKEVVDAHLRRLLQCAIAPIKADRDVAQKLAERLAEEKALWGKGGVGERRWRKLSASHLAAASAK